jgi:23S rRNA (guanosine2251-2'-O)-methyltransferase
MEGKDYRKIDFRGPCVLVVGSEGEGISRLVLENSDVQVSLPMKGHIDSLNASVAAGIMMYRVLESRHA